MSAVLHFTPRRLRRAGGGGGSEPLTLEVIRAEIEHGVQAALDTADRLIGLLDRMDQHRFSAGKGGDKARAEMQGETGKILGEMGKLRKGRD